MWAAARCAPLAGGAVAIEHADDEGRVLVERLAVGHAEGGDVAEARMVEEMACGVLDVVELLPPHQNVSK
jgi:hypothetical protein